MNAFSRHLLSSEQRKISLTILAWLILVSSLLLSVPLLSCAEEVAQQQMSSSSSAGWEVKLSGDIEEKQELIEVVARQKTDLAKKSITLNIMPGEKGSGILEATGAGMDQLREFIFSNEVREGGIMNGPTEIKIAGRVAKDQFLTVLLETNPSTGYTWEVDRSSTLRLAQHGPATFQAKGSLPGNPAVQRLTMKAEEAGDGRIRFIHRRPFDPDAIGVASIAVDMSSLPQTIDLSNPASLPVSALQRRGQYSTPSDRLLRGDLPSYFDWRERGGVSAIKDQKTCGSCWAFSTVGVLESALKIKYGLEFDLSEQFLVSCNQDEWSCAGGSWAHNYHLASTSTGAQLGNLQTIYGAVLEKDMPYKSSDGTCKKVDSHLFWMASWTALEIPTDDDLKSIIYTYGPVGVSVCVGPAFKAYKSGIFETDESSLCASGNNHVVVVVGWDDVLGYWILKNSWGPRWGEKGYMNMKRGISNIAADVAYLENPGANWTYQITQKTRNVSYKENTVVINVSAVTPSPLPSVAVSDPSWASVKSQTWNGQRGTVMLKVLSNGGSLSRASGVTIGTNAPNGGELFEVIQSGTPCSIVGINPTMSPTFTNAGGSGSFNVNVFPEDCEWVVGNPFSYWVHAGQKGTGDQQVDYTVDANNTGLQRRATLTVTLGQNQKKSRFTVNQSK